MNPRRNQKRKKRMSLRGRAPLSDVGPVEVGADYMIVHLGSLNSMQRRLAKRHAKQVRRDMRHNMRAMGKMISAQLWRLAEQITATSPIAKRPVKPAPKETP